jgi:predicted RecA/RadA family phage recombinase
MAKNYVQDDDRITLAAPYEVASGSGALVGTLFGVAIAGAANAATVTLQTRGVHDLLAEGAVSGQDIAVGGAVYWDDAAKRCTKTSTSNTKIGVAVAAKASAATVVRVRLNGTA